IGIMAVVAAGIEAVGEVAGAPVARAELNFKFVHKGVEPLAFEITGVLGQPGQFVVCDIHRLTSRSGINGRSPRCRSALFKDTCKAAMASGGAAKIGNWKHMVKMENRHVPHNSSLRRASQPS